MVSDKQIEANRQNAVLSTGPATAAGIETARFNAVRHGLRSLQTIVPGEAPEEWEDHRAAVVVDLKPEGAIELALAEQIAAKLWRLGRVVRHEADMIAIAQDPAELANVHEATFKRANYSYTPKRTDIPNHAEVQEAARDARKAKEKAIGQIEAIPTMGETDSFPGWDLYEALRDTLSLKEEELENIFEDEEEGPLEVRNVRAMLAVRGNPDEGVKVMPGIWRKQKVDAEAKAVEATKRHKNLKRRYEAALERSRLSRGLPVEAALVKIQRYEAHLERGLHKALERLQTLHEARGASRPVTSPRWPWRSSRALRPLPEWLRSAFLASTDRRPGPDPIDFGKKPGGRRKRWAVSAPGAGIGTTRRGRSRAASRSTAVGSCARGR